VTLLSEPESSGLEGERPSVDLAGRHLEVSEDLLAWNAPTEWQTMFNAIQGGKANAHLTHMVVAIVNSVPYEGHSL
jgi:hypothetical protein